MINNGKYMISVLLFAKMTIKDNNQDGKIFYKEIDIWDVILNVL